MIWDQWDAIRSFRDTYILGIFLPMFSIIATPRCYLWSSFYPLCEGNINRNDPLDIHNIKVIVFLFSLMSLPFCFHHKLVGFVDIFLWIFLLKGGFNPFFFDINFVSSYFSNIFEKCPFLCSNITSTWHC